MSGRAEIFETSYLKSKRITYQVFNQIPLINMKSRCKKEVKESINFIFKQNNENQMHAKVELLQKIIEKETQRIKKVHYNWEKLEQFSSKLKTYSLQYMWYE